MVNMSDPVNRRTMMKFQRVIETKDVNLVKETLKNNSQLIRPTYRNLDILTIDYIAQFFIEYGYLLKQLNPIYEVLTKNIPYGLKDKEEIELLLHLINLNIKEENFNPLRVAVHSADLRWVELLLKNGAQFGHYIFSCNNFSYHGKINQFSYDGKSKAVQVLLSVLKYDTNINKTTLLTTLAVNPVLKSEVFIEMAEILIKAGAYVNGEATDLEFPLINAIRLHRHDIALFIIEKGAELDYMYPSGLAKGGTVLHYACQFAKVDYISLLIEKGANITITDWKGRSPFIKLIIEHFLSIKGNAQYDLEFKSIKAITSFVKEIARAKFESRKIISSDLSIIEGYPNFSEILTKCNHQLGEMKSPMFYPPYSLVDVLGMRNKNIKKFADLLKNEDFALNLEAILSSKNTDDLYYEDLNKIFKKAIVIRNKYNELELTLESSLGKYIHSH